MFRRAFTLVELLITISIIAIIFSFFIPGFLRQYRQTQQSETLAVLLSDVRAQQTKAMSGYHPSGSAPQNYSILFNTDNYILFPGSVYNPADPENYSISLEPGQEFTGVTFPSSQITFSPISGEISNFIQPAYTFSLIDHQNNIIYTLTLNKYGAFTSLN